MASSSSSNSKLTMKLLIDTKNEKVLFAEASKAVVDFLFHILSLPLATVVKLISKNGMVGSIENVYQSFQDLNETYMHPQQSKDLLLNPTAAISSHEFCNLFPTVHNKPMNSSHFLIMAELDKEDQDDEEEEKEDDDDDNEEDDDEDETEEDDDDEEDGDYEDEMEEENLGCTMYYRCPNKCGDDVTCDVTTICSRCNIAMSLPTNLVLNTKDVEENILIKNGLVKDNVTFLVMDDLVIQPLSSAISMVTLLNNKFNIKEFGALQEMVVELGLDEGIKLLKASLRSKMVLTSVFIKKEN
ncbi:unnamed protein product [Trifolium pratense]|uniref:Uncharacterized protein n=1 Tax=Trifolium pratense TaxID=57577 RepID=A0ACB0IGH5_TRIPR|nr:unnamed protein product [Trifolium pratense]